VCVLRSWYVSLVADALEPKTPREGEPAEKTARTHPNDPLHGLTLRSILTQLHARYGWEELGRVVQIRCFTHDPSMGSSLAFLRRQPWARQEVEALFLRSLDEAEASAVSSGAAGADGPDGKDR
jgi:uncharacterized protein (DUF2132 family)